MAAVIIGCCGVLSSRFSRKRKERINREKDYTENFESLKEANAMRVRHLSDAGVPGYERYSGSNFTGSTYNATSTEIGRPSSNSRRGASWDSQQGVQEMSAVAETDWACVSRTPPSYEDTTRH